MTGFTALRLLDARRLRALALAAGVDPVDAVPRRDTPPDADLLDLTADPFDDVADVFDRLRELERRLRSAGDRRAVFLTIYTRMTAAVRDAIDAGRFADGPWMRRYTVTFADHYRRAFDAFERGRLSAVPDPWLVAFGTARAGDALVAQDAFLGINAHINYDLALALHEIGIDPNRHRKRADHDEIDAVLTDLIDAQQAALTDLYAPGLADVDATLGPVDEALSLFSMTEGRAQAWRLATVLTDASWLFVRRCARWLLRATAVGGAVVTRSPPLDSTLLAALRRVERGVDLETMLTQLAARLDGVD
ncbi:DUF5995 family protein [Haloplanus sp. C73]|uniref:DUF5995 family protein n=1 Tax=Haloplanus sp. C73 TaxID=3421641 RepID=UPI003EB72E6E